jgi:hypothetical protein
VGAGPVENPKQCRVDAKTAYKSCGGECREDFQVGKDACRGRDHDCVEGCRSDRQTCRDPIQNTLDSDVAACNATRDSAVQNCKSLYPPGSQRDQCIDNAQVDAFECRDQSRENVRPGFEICRVGFRSCAKACPPSSASPAFIDD